MKPWNVTLRVCRVHFFTTLSLTFQAMWSDVNFATRPFSIENQMDTFPHYNVTLSVIFGWSNS